MRTVRLATPDGPAFGRIEDDRVRTLTGAPWLPGSRPTSTVLALDEAHLLAPVTPATIFAVGRNYAAHATELGLAVTPDPSIFMKPVSALLGPGEAVVLPPADLSTRVEHEAELVVVMGARTRGIEPADAVRHVYGYTCGNDVTARDLQGRDSHITRAKGFDTFLPVGPWIETDLDLCTVRVSCQVNGEHRQDQAVAEMVHDVPTVIASISRWATLMPGDLILTGSPAGSGPLAGGDTVEITVTGLGTLTHTVIAAPGKETGRQSRDAPAPHNCDTPRRKP